MALGNVYMTDTDGNIGSSVSASTEQVCGLLFDISGQGSTFWTTGTGKDLADNWQDQVIELNSLQDAVDLGITAYTGDTDSETGKSTDFLAGIPYFHISQFFGMAGGTGRLFVMFADCSSGWSPLIEMQRACNGIISQFGVWTEQNLWVKPDEKSTGYSIQLVSDLQSVAENMADDYFAPASILLCANTSRVKIGQTTSTSITFSEIPDAVIGARYVSVLISQSMDDDVRAMQAALDSTTPVGFVGMALGALTQASVGESIAWVQQFDYVGYAPTIEFGFGDATISSTTGRLTNSTRYAALTKYQLDDLDTKGYMFLRLYEGLEGHVYINKDQTCSNQDFCTIARNRAINKSRRLIRQALLPYVNSPIKVDPSSGNLTSAQVTVFTNLISDILDSMESAEEISGTGTISVPAAQNILVTKTLTLSYSIVPLGCAESIEVTEGLAVSS